MSGSPRATANDLRTPAARLFRRNAFWTAAAVQLMVTGLALLVTKQLATSIVFIQLGWALALAGGGSAMLRFEGTRHAVGVAAVAASSTFFLGLLAWETGGLSSPIIPLLPVMPMGTALFLQDEVPATISSAVACLLVNALIMGEAGASLGQFGAESATIAILSGVAIFGTYGFRNTRLNSLDNERARLDALEKLRIAEQARGQSERLAIVGKIAAGVAHEINNPLAFVKSNLTYMREELATTGALGGKEISELLDDTGIGVERIRQIVADLKTLSSTEGREVKSVAVGDVAAEALKLAKAKLGTRVQLGCDLSADLPQVLVDSRRLSQVILNLLVNAGDALEELPGTAPRIQVGATVGLRSLALVVEDNGPGIAPAALGKLFEPFFTTKPPGKGTGLGLAISREYVEAFGGTLRAENRDEGGARFTIELPLAPKGQRAVIVN